MAIKIMQNLGRRFLTLWFGETLSMLGMMLMEFALGVWVYQRTGSALEFSNVILASTVPAMLVMPFAGSLVDRVNRRYVLVAADCIVGMMTLALALLISNEGLELWHLYAFNGVGAVVNSFKMPAYNASVSLMLPKDKFVRASGMMGLSASVLSMVAPMAAGGLMGTVGLSGIVTIDLIAFSLASLLVFKAFYNLMPVAADAEDTEATGSIKRFSTALTFFRRQPLMLSLLFYEAIQGGLLALASTMLIPLVLSRHSTEELGVILACGSMGSLISALVLVAVSDFRRLIIGFLLSDAILALCVLFMGIYTSSIFYMVCIFVALFSVGIGEGCVHALWMRKAPHEYQGRIFALIGTITLVSTSFAVLSGGLITDSWFEPALALGGRWEESIGAWLGTGKGRGLGLMFVICGSLGLLVSFGALCHTRLRSLDLIVPDVLAPNAGWGDVMLMDEKASPAHGATYPGRQDRANVGSVQPVIQVRNLVKAYQVGGVSLPILKNVNFSVHPGEFVAIMGPSGSGKSTLLNVLGILDRYDEGEYRLNGTLIRELSETQSAQYRSWFIGFVFQSFNLLPFKSAVDNVALPLYYSRSSRKEREAKAHVLLERMGLAERAYHRPSELSGGQRQRVAIARALVNDPPLILADEPTGNLDSAASEDMMNLFEEINREGKTLVLITHDEAIAARTHRVIRLKDGKIHS